MRARLRLWVCARALVQCLNQDDSKPILNALKSGAKYVIVPPTPPASLSGL